MDPKSANCIKVGSCEKQFVGKYKHTPLVYNKDVYVHETATNENQVCVLFWYLDSDNKNKGSWRLANGNPQCVEESIKHIADPESSKCGGGLYYLAWKIPVENKWDNFDENHLADSGYELNWEK